MTTEEISREASLWLDRYGSQSRQYERSKDRLKTLARECPMGIDRPARRAREKWRVKCIRLREEMHQTGRHILKLLDECPPDVLNSSEAIGLAITRSMIERTLATSEAQP